MLTAIIMLSLVVAHISVLKLCLNHVNDAKETRDSDKIYHIVFVLITGVLASVFSYLFWLILLGKWQI